MNREDTQTAVPSEGLCKPSILSSEVIAIRSSLEFFPKKQKTVCVWAVTTVFVTRMSTDDAAPLYRAMYLWGIFPTVRQIPIVSILDTYIRTWKLFICPLRGKERNTLHNWYRLPEVIRCIFHLNKVSRSTPVNWEDSSSIKLYPLVNRSCSNLNWSVSNGSLALPYRPSNFVCWIERTRLSAVEFAVYVWCHITSPPGNSPMFFGTMHCRPCNNRCFFQLDISSSSGPSCGAFPDPYRFLARADDPIYMSL